MNRGGALSALLALPTERIAYLDAIRRLLRCGTSTRLNSTGNPITPKSPGCKGWQQFIFSNFNNGGFIQHWLIGYFDNRAACSKDVDVEHGGCCPPGWTTCKPTASIPGA